MEENLLTNIVRDAILNNFRRNTSIVISRYYNNPPQGGYQINEEHEYILPDNDDISSIAFLEVVNLFGKENKIPQKKFNHLKFKKIKEDDPLINTVCSICLENYKKNDYYRTLNCNHIFHKKCVDRWFKKNHLNCPMCRANVNLN